MEENGVVGGVLEHLNVLMQEHQLLDIIFPALGSGGCQSETWILATSGETKQEQAAFAHTHILPEQLSLFSSAGFSVIM